MNFSNEYSMDHVEISLDDIRFHFWFYKVIIPILYGIIVFLGTLGNVMVITVICSRKDLRTNMNVLLLNLAIGDLLFLVVCVPFVTYHFSADNWQLGELICRVWMYVLYVTVYVTVYTLVAVALLRYLTIVRDQLTSRWRTPHVMVLTSAVIWATMVLVNVPILDIYRLKEFSLTSTTTTAGPLYTTYRYCGVRDKTTGRYLFPPFFVFSYCLPLAAVVTLYVYVLRYLRNMKSISTGTSNRAEDRTQHATRVLGVVVITFAVCWLPLHLHLLVSYFAISSRSKLYQVSRGLFHCLAYGNSCMNPIIYSVVSNDFRKAFRNLVHKCRGKRKTQDHNNHINNCILGKNTEDIIAKQSEALLNREICTETIT